MKVTGFDLSVSSKTAEKIFGAAAVDVPDNGENIALIVNHALNVKGRETNLLNPMQMCLNDVEAN